MTLTQPLDLWHLIVVKLAGSANGLDNTLAVFTFLMLIVISMMAGRFKMTAMAVYMFIALFSIMMSQAVNGAGIFAIMALISITAFVFVLVKAIKETME